MANQLNHTELVSAASNMLSRVFGDDSVDREQTRESLEELCDEIKDYLRTLDDDERDEEGE